MRLVIGLFLFFLIASPPASAETLKVTETAGIRRFGYPVTATVRVDQPLPKDVNFRLTENGKPVAAQFTRQDDQSVEIDFNVSLGPFEERSYMLHYGPDIPSPSSTDGMKIETTADTFRVIHSDNLEFVVPKNLLGLLRSVKTKKYDYLRPDSPGLIIQYKDEIPFRVGGDGPWGEPTRATITKQGPLACALRFESTEALRGGRSVKSRVDMEFPRSKSWVKITWTIDDPQGFVAGMGADLNLKIQGEPTLVDFGAGNSAYVALKKGQSVDCERRIFKRDAFGSGGFGGRSLASDFSINLLERASVVPLVRSAWPLRSGDEFMPERWVHLMDRERCTAAGLGPIDCEIAKDRIHVFADGRLQLWHEPQAAKKTAIFYYHFVPMPVHVGALTSPQSMLSPLKVEVSR